MHSTALANSYIQKTHSVLEGRRSTNNVNSSSTSIPRAHMSGQSVVEKPSHKTVRDKSGDVRHKYQPHSIREPNKSASSSGVGMFAKDYSTA